VRERTNIVTCRLVGDAQYHFADPTQPPVTEPPTQLLVNSPDAQLTLLTQIAESMTALVGRIELIDAKLDRLQKMATEEATK
jgi:hypothetical protein